MEWTDEAVSTVADMLRQKKTAREIAAVFGITRNAVIGKVSRHPDLYPIGLVHGRGNRPLNLDEKRARMNVYHAGYRAERKAKKALAKKAEPAPPTAKILSVEEWISKNGVRRFGRGESSDYYAIVPYLAQRGYTLTTRSGQKHYLSKTGESPREIRWGKVIEMVDRFRQADGLQAFRVAS